jgi:hypothetical protein
MAPAVANSMSQTNHFFCRLSLRRFSTTISKDESLNHIVDKWHALQEATKKLQAKHDVVVVVQTDEVTNYITAIAVSVLPFARAPEYSLAQPHNGIKQVAFASVYVLVLWGKRSNH